MPEEFLDGTGLLPDLPDERDYPYGAFVEVAGAVSVDWNKGYDVEKELGVRLKREDQNGSLSCVGQSTHKYAEALNLVETGELMDLSAKDVYSWIFIEPDGAAYLRDGVKQIVKRGVATESLVPSYENGKPPSESFMRQRAVSAEIEKVALRYQGKDYYSVPADIDQFADAIQRTKGLLMGAVGCNRTWQTADVKPPEYSDAVWGHAIFGIGYGIRNGKKAIKFLNSWGARWGEDGCGWLNEAYFKAQRVYPAWVLVDKPNESFLDTMKWVILPDKHQYLLTDKPVKLAVSIPDEAALKELQANGLQGEPEAVADLDGYILYRGASEQSWRAFLNL